MNDASALVLLHDVELLFDELVDHVEGRFAAIGARAWAQLVLLGLEMARYRLAPRGLRLRLRLLLFRQLLGSRRTLLEGAQGFALDGRRCGGRLLDRELSVLALRDREHTVGGRLSTSAAPQARSRTSRDHTWRSVSIVFMAFRAEPCAGTSHVAPR